MAYNTKIDIEELKLLVKDGASIADIVRHFGVSRSGAEKCLYRNGIRTYGSLNDPPKELITREELRRLYLEESLGVLAISKRINQTQGCVWSRLKRMGIIDSSRQFKASGLPRRKRRLVSQEFKAATKRMRYDQENGVCQECKQAIGSWRSATYHHIIACRSGGGPEPENCMVLHKECHNDPVIFRKLHGSDFYMMQNVYAGRSKYDPPMSDD